MSIYFNKPRGEWLYNFVVRGERHSAYCVDPDTGERARNRTDAKRIEDKLKVAARDARPAPVAPDAYILAQALAAYIPRKRGKANWQNERTYIHEVTTWFGAWRPIVGITEALCWEYIAWAREQPVLIYAGGRRKPTDEERRTKPARLFRPAPAGRKRDDATINRYLNPLREALRIAHETPDPADPAKVRRLLAYLPKIPRLDEPEDVPRPISDEDLLRIVAASPEHLADAVMLVRNMGFRKAEVFAIEDAQFDAALRGVYLWAEDTKGKRGEFVPANEAAMAILLRRRAGARALGIRHLFWYVPPGSQADGSPKPPRTIRNPKRAWRTALRTLGLAGQHTFHNTKASFVTQTALTSSAAVTQQAARHKDPRTTQRYIKVADPVRRAAADSISFAVPIAATGSARKQDSQTVAVDCVDTGVIPLETLVGATGFEPATPRPPVLGTPAKLLKFKATDRP